ncbi:1-acyl-sn-glycerol-3-phosphate acyltransferase [Endozoicomonas sp. NE40]|uniref:1-acyl-sn-glycerol-3-phosphate acyltransferase n=2 Tax=Endozoicomonas lisbonensis TaxID=3120522 RepID=A0ABV2SJ75_9GAMM
MSVVVYSLRTILLYLALTVWTVCWSSFMLIGLPLAPFRKRHILVKIWGHVTISLTRWIAGVKWEVKGKENIPDTPCVIVCNHQSSWETFFLQTLFTPQTQVIKKSLLNIPFFGWAFRLIKPIAIDRDDPRRSLQQIVEQGKQALEDNVWVLIFPEGTRVPNGELGKFSRGGINLARKAERNILPVAHNAGSCWPNTSWIKRPGTISIRIGKEISIEGKTPAQLNEESRQWIEKALEEMNTAD